MRSIARTIPLIAALTLALYACSGGGGVEPVANGADPLDPLEPLTFSHVGRTPLSDSFRDAASIGNVIFAVGGGGAVIAKLPGQGWVPLSRVTRQALFGIVIVDANTLVAVGQQVIIRSEDGGANWQVVAENIGALRAVARNEDLVAAVGSSTVLISTDEGKTWKASPNPPGFALDHVAVLANKRVVAMTGDARLFESDDAGDNWREILDFDDLTEQMTFGDETTGLITLGSPAEMHRTIDGGKTWKKLDFAERVHDIVLSDADNGALVTVDGDVYTTSNAGNNWTPMPFSIPIDEFDVIPRVLVQSSVSIAVVGDAGYIVESVGGGAFLKIHKGSPGIIRHVGISSRAGVGAISDFDKPMDFVVSTDEGDSWSLIDLDIGIPRQIIIEGDNGLIVTKKTIERSASGGIGWNTILDDAAASFADAAIIDGQRFVVCGADGTLLRTPDGGDNWQDVVPTEAVGKQLSHVDFFEGGTIGIAVAPDVMLRSTDGGETWSPVTFFGQGAVALACADANVAILVDAGRNVWRTSDAGLTWTIVDQVPSSPSAVAFANGRRGLMVGRGGRILETLDGGLTWAEPAPVTGNGLSDVAFLDDDTAVLVGDRGTILKGVAP